MSSSSSLWRWLPPFSHINLLSVRHWKQSMSIECNHLIWFDSRIMSWLGSFSSRLGHSTKIQCSMSPPSFEMEITHRQHRHTRIWMRSRSSNKKALLCIDQFKHWRNTCTPSSQLPTRIAPITMIHYTCNEKRLFISNLFFIFAEAHMWTGFPLRDSNSNCVHQSSSIWMMMMHCHGKSILEWTE